MNVKKWVLILSVLILCVGVGATQASAAAPYAPVFSENNNLTILNAAGEVTGGANDILFTWDGTVKTSVATSLQVSNAIIMPWSSNTQPTCWTGTGGSTWTVHDVAVYGPGIYTVYASCGARSPGCATGTNPITFTVGTGEIGVHMLLNTSATLNIDVVNVWQLKTVFGPSPLWTGVCGSNSANKVWDLMSKDIGTGINGYPMVDGPYIGSRWNFNMTGAPVNRVIDTANNNFTMIDSSGLTFGGTNDVRFTWDGTKKTSVAASGQVSNASISSFCAFFGNTWWAHDVAIYGPGTYTVYDGCAAGSPGCGFGNPVTFTVKSGEIGGHMLFQWSKNENIDVVDVWKPGVFQPMALWSGACGTGDPAQVWDYMSYDWNEDGINGGPMTDGPFAGSYANFNMMGMCAGCGACDPPDCNDNDPCTTDTCDPVTGCVHTPVANCCTSTAQCNDSDVCTEDACVNNLCVHTLYNGGHCCSLCDNVMCDPVGGCPAAPCYPDSYYCTDNNACTLDSCDPATGCVYTVINCDDADACTIDTCDTATGCVHTPISNCSSTVDTVNNNFTMIDAGGLTFGGTNDVHFTWDGTKKTSVAASGQVSNASLTSTCPFFGLTWLAHDMAIYGPGTYTIFDACSPGSPGCGIGNPVTFTVNPGEIGGHMLFDWNHVSDIDVVDVWMPNAEYGPSELWTGNCGANDHSTLWDWMSSDWDGDGINGAPMTDGPFFGANINFNLMGKDCNASVCNDNNDCTIDSCPDPETGLCAHTPRVCNDNNACSADMCDPAVGCVYTPNVVCNDNNICTTDTCDPTTGNCAFIPIDCNDSNECTTDSCNPTVGCLHSPNNAPCSDGNVCTSDDLCANGTCKGTAIVCNDSNECTIDTCKPTSGGCVYTPVSCSDSDPCSFDTCEPATGNCVHTPLGATCEGSINNNFTIIDYTGLTFGGTNDVEFTWDGTKKTSVAASGQVSNASLTSTCPLFGLTWLAHDMAIYGPGTYTIFDACSPGSPGCGIGNPVTFTVNPGEIGGHMLFDWNHVSDIDVVDVWRAGVFEPMALWATDCGTGDPAQVWDYMSYDWNGDGINGAGMTDGPFAGTSVNFNLMGTPTCTGSCDDGDVCTTDTFGANCACVHSAVVCNNNNACTVGSCDPATGSCAFADKCAATEMCNPADGTCIAACPAGSVKTAKIRGGGQNPRTVDLQIQTEFTVMNDGCIVNTSVNNIACSPGTLLLVNVKAGRGPMPTNCTWKGAAIGWNAPFTIQCPDVSGTMGRLICDNKDGGGKDADRITISVQ